MLMEYCIVVECVQSNYFLCGTKPTPRSQISKYFLEIYLENPPNSFSPIISQFLNPTYDIQYASLRRNVQER